MPTVIEIKKNTSAAEVRKILRKSRRQYAQKENGLAAFLGKLPAIEDGMTYQKKARNEWK
jgi:hypothetical protein